MEYHDNFCRDSFGLPAAIAGTIELSRTGELSVILFILLALAFLVTGFVVFVERGQRRITVNYARQQRAGQSYAGQSSNLPLKLNMAGVIPPIFCLKYHSFSSNNSWLVW